MRPRYRYEAGELHREWLDVCDDDGSPTGEKGYVSVPGFDIIDELRGSLQPIAFTEDRDAAERIVGALNMADAV